MNILLTDIDECLTENAGCGQICTNTMGSFVCSCNQGFTLSSDGRNCTGKLQTYLSWQSHNLARIRDIIMHCDFRY